jgi:hypothetical protein
MSKSIEDILAPKPEARPRIYAYAIAEKAHAGLLKVGQTTREVEQRTFQTLNKAVHSTLTRITSPAVASLPDRSCATGEPEWPWRFK